MARQQIAADNAPVSAALVADGYPGVIRPRDVTTVALPAAITVRRVVVAVGDHVTAGQTLIELDDEEAQRSVGRLALDAARAKEQTRYLERSVERLDQSIHALTLNVANAAAQLAIAQRHAETIPKRQWKDSAERAQAAYDQAIAHERRTAELAATGVVARQELEDAQIAIRVAADDLAVAKRSAEAQQKVVALQVDQARAQAELSIADKLRTLADRNGELSQVRLRQTEAEQALEAARARLNDLTVRAAADGLVARIAVRPGARVPASAPLLELATIDPMVVNVDVPASIVNTLKRGGAAEVHLSGADSEHYAGRILTIAPLPGDSGTHTLEVEFRNRSGLLLSGRAARVRLLVSR